MKIKRTKKTMAMVNPPMPAEIPMMAVDVMSESFLLEEGCDSFPINDVPGWSAEVCGVWTVSKVVLERPADAVDSKLDITSSAMEVGVIVSGIGATDEDEKETS